MSRLFGLFPFHIDRERTGQIIGEHIEYFNMVQSSIIILVCAASFIHTIIDFNIQSPNLDRATDVVIFEIQIFKIVRYILNICYVIFDIINRKRFVDILKKFDTFDEEVTGNNSIEISLLSIIKCHSN